MRRTNNKATKHVDSCLKTSRDGGSNPPASIVLPPWVGDENTRDAQHRHGGATRSAAESLVLFENPPASIELPPWVEDENTRDAQHRHGDLTHLIPAYKITCRVCRICVISDYFFVVEKSFIIHYQ